MTEVLEEAWELEEKGMSEEDFQAFTFGNAVKLVGPVSILTFLKARSWSRRCRKLTPSFCPLVVSQRTTL